MSYIVVWLELARIFLETCTVLSTSISQNLLFRPTRCSRVSNRYQYQRGHEIWIMRLDKVCPNLYFLDVTYTIF